MTTDAKYGRASATSKRHPGRDESAAIRLFLVDDHPLVREGLKRVLSSMMGVIIVGEAATGEEAVARVSDLQPDIVLMDLSLPRMSGMEATRAIKAASPATQVLALTMHKEEAYVRAALDAGASGYLAKDARPSDLVDAIETVYRGEHYLKNR